MSPIPCPGKKILLVDDHTLIRAALCSILKDTYANALIHESTDGADIIEKLVVTAYDLIIMDMQMPNCESLWLINYIHINHPAVPVLIYSMTAENIYALRVIQAGAKGFVRKESSKEELKKAIDLAMNGRIYLSEAVTEVIALQAFKKSETPFTILSPAGIPDYNVTPGRQYRQRDFKVAGYQEFYCRYSQRQDLPKT
ncbi:MAG: response regulator transcription factor [Bacteroidota bacterium]